MNTFSINYTVFCASCVTLVTIVANKLEKRWNSHISVFRGLKSAEHNYISKYWVISCILYNAISRGEISRVWAPFHSIVLSASPKFDITRAKMYRKDVVIRPIKVRLLALFHALRHYLYSWQPSFTVISSRRTLATCCDRLYLPTLNIYKFICKLI